MRIRHVAAMSVVTVFAVAVMLASTWKGSRPNGLSSESEGEIEESPAPVSIEVAAPRTIEVLQRYSGMIEPQERLTLAFEISGRLETLGENSNGQVFDEGVRVAKGDVLARLDDRELVALKAEADALFQQANQENDRAVKLNQKNPLAINEVELLTRATTLKINAARVQLAEERLRNATLRSSVDGVISKRFLLPGESVSPHQPVFEILQMDHVILKVGVPESKIRPLLARLQERRRLLEVGAGESAPPFKAYVQLVGTDAFGNPWDREPFEVFSISESADDKTGLFEVEILLENQHGDFRPGQIAVAEIVADRMEGFELPSTAGIFQEGKGYVYALEEVAGKLHAVKVELKRGAYLEQQGKLVLRNLSPRHRRIVTKGQHRLAPGRLVRIVEDNDPVGSEETADLDGSQAGREGQTTSNDGSNAGASSTRPPRALLDG